MFNGFRLGRVAGIDVQVDWSLLIIFTLVTFSLGAGVFPTWHPNWSPGLIWLTAFVAALLFFASVLVHELSHALVGRLRGIDVKRITLFIFGGVAHMEREPEAWRAELWMAAVGPITSLILGAMFLFLGGLAAGDVELDPEKPERMLASLGPVATLLLWLGPINIILGVFNLIPGFPLDGGRVLRAILWGVSHDLRLATRWASRIGQLVAWIFIAVGVAMMFGARVPFFGTGLMSGLWLAFIGWFLNNAALMSYRQLLVRESLEDVPVSRIMQSHFVSVRPDMTISQFVDEHLMSSDQRAFPVMEADRFIGLVCLQDIRKLGRENWPQERVRDIMTPVSSLAQIAPSVDAADALLMLSRNNVNQLPVVEHGHLRGLIRREDILRLLSLYGDPRLAQV
jgi:Zn-dependent protease/predicted transcriptional regulator